MKRIPGFLQRSRYAVCYFRGYYSEIERENTSFTTTVIKNSELKRRPTPKFVTLTHLSFQWASCTYQSYCWGHYLCKFWSFLISFSSFWSRFWKKLVPSPSMLLLRAAQPFLLSSLLLYFSAPFSSTVRAFTRKVFSVALWAPVT